MKKVLVFLADGFEEVEALTVVDVMRRAGVECTTAAVGNDLTVKSSHGVNVMADKLLSDIKELYDCVVVPGGVPGIRNLQKSRLVLETVQKHNDAEKLVSAICAGPVVLKSAGVIEGRNVTCYPGFEEELGNVIYKKTAAISDGNIITGRGVGCAFEFAFEILEKLGYGQKVSELRKSTIYEL